VIKRFWYWKGELLLFDVHPLTGVSTGEHGELEYVYYTTPASIIFIAESDEPESENVRWLELRLSAEGLSLNKGTSNPIIAKGTPLPCWPEKLPAFIVARFLKREGKLIGLIGTEVLAEEIPKQKAEALARSWLPQNPNLLKYLEHIFQEAER